MMQSQATTIDEYIANLPQDRSEDIKKIRAEILQHIPKGYEEGMVYGMITYFIPLSKYPVTYNGQPLCLVSVASQKNYISVYLMNVYGNPKIQDWFEKEFKKSGKKLNMGKSCLRFKKVDDIPLDLIGKTVAKTSPAELIEWYEKSRGISS